MSRHMRDKLTAALVRGDLAGVKTLRDAEHEAIRGSIIMAEENLDKTWKVYAHCLGWVGERARIMSRKDFARLIERYDFEVMDFTYGFIINPRPYHGQLSKPPAVYAEVLAKIIEISES